MNTSSPQTSDSSIKIRIHVQLQNIQHSTCDALYLQESKQTTKWPFSKLRPLYTDEVTQAYRYFYGKGSEALLPLVESFTASMRHATYKSKTNTRDDSF